MLETTLASAAQFSNLVAGEGSGLAPVLACFLLIIFPFSSFWIYFLWFFSLFVLLFGCKVCFCLFFFPFLLFISFFFFLLPWLTVKRVVFLKGKA